MLLPQWKCYFHCTVEVLPSLRLTPDSSTDRYSLAPATLSHSVESHTLDLVQRVLLQSRVLRLEVVLDARVIRVYHVRIVHLASVVRDEGERELWKRGVLTFGRLCSSTISPILFGICSICSAIDLVVNNRTRKSFTTEVGIIVILETILIATKK